MRPHYFSIIVASLLWFVSPSTELRAELKLPSFFSNQMVLQRDKPVSIWGWADANTQVDVAFRGNAVSTKANGVGRWQVTLPAMKASEQGRKMVIETGNDRIEIQDILIGEVWFASGQSNMAFKLQNSLDAKSDLPKSQNQAVRFFLAENTPASQPQTNIAGTWNLSSPETSGNFSAVAYYFAEQINQETGIPVGIIQSCWGGKRSECYTSREAMLSNTHGKKMIAELDRAAKSFDPVEAKKKHDAAMATWKKRVAQVQAQNKNKEKSKRARFPRRPQPAKPTYENERNPTVLYNGMIHPFVGYTMRGAIWYQGEANAKAGLAEIYQEMFTLMILDWRERWGDDFPFYFAQLANFKSVTTKPGQQSDWATVQNQQRKTLELVGTGMATINDVGDANDIHPKNKKTVGLRLARWALNKDYQKPVVVSGPLYHSSRVEAGKMIIEFTHTGTGLKTSDGKPLQRFEITGDNQTWHWADAKISNNKIIVSCAAVPKPTAVRYAWAANPAGANLVNSENLPTSIFSTRGD
jgi:sialate O-acetylesterase